jgi:hypothetical protein
MVLVDPIASRDRQAKRSPVEMTTTHRITATAAVLLSLATASAPTAGARPADYVPPDNQTPASIYSRPDKSMASVNSPSSLDGGSAPNPTLPPVLPSIKPAQIAAIDQTERQAAAYALPSGSQFSNAETNAYADTTNRDIKSAAVAAATPRTGFDWGDAGIGAAGGLALAILGLGAGLVISQRRPRRTGHTTALPS